MFSQMTDVLRIGERLSGSIVDQNQYYKDYSIDLIAGTEYAFYLEGLSLYDSVLTLRNSSGAYLESNDDIDTHFSGFKSGSDSLNSLLYYTPVASGSYLLEASGKYNTWDGLYDEGTFEISAWTTDETPILATAIGVGNTISKTIEHELDEDYFEIKLIAGRTYDFDLNKNTLNDPYFFLEDADGNVLDEDDDSGNGASNAFIRYTAPTTNNYYLVASDSGYNYGTYTVSASQLKYDESLDTANNITSGTTETGDLLYSGDNNWYKIQLDSGKGYRFTVVGETLSDPKLQLRDSSGAVIAENDDSNVGNDPILNYLATGQGSYFLDVSDSSDAKTGRYKLTALETDESVSTANTLKAGQSESSSIQYTNDKDWYSIELIKSSRYNFNLSAITLKDPELKLRDSSGTLITSDDNSGAGNNASIGLTATSSGTFFLDAGSVDSNDTGSYKLTTARVIDRDTTPRGAIKIKLNTPMAGEIDYITEHDWHKTKLKKGISYHLEITGTELSNPSISLRDKKGKILESNNSDTSTAFIEISPKKSGLYILDAGAKQDALTGTYNITAWQTDQSAKTAQKLKPRADKSGSIDYLGDEDWYKMKLKPGNYQFGLEGSSMKDPALQLLNSKGKVLLSDDDGGRGNNAMITTSIDKKGTYYLNATASGGDATGTYLISSSLI